RQLRNNSCELLLEPAQPLDSILDCRDGVLEDDLLRGMNEALRGQPAVIRTGPVIPNCEDPAMLQQERQQLLALATKILGRCHASTHQVANRLVHIVRYPHGSELASTEQPRQGERITP